MRDYKLKTKLGPLTLLIGISCALAMAQGAMAVAANEADEIAQTQEWFERAFSAEIKSTPEAAGMEIRRQDQRPLALRTSILGTPIKIGDEHFEHGLGSHAFSELVLHSPSGIKKFTAKVGVDDHQASQMNNGSVIFTLEAGGKEIFRSPLCKGGDAPIAVNIDVPNAKALVLRVLDGGDGVTCDQADWADAKIEMGDGQSTWVDELPKWSPGGSASTAPFSFVYGGASSASLLTDWRVKVQSEKSDNGKRQRTITYTDPTTGLELRCEATLFADSPAVEWVMYATNKGTTDTPILERFFPLDIGLTTQTTLTKEVIFHHSRGSSNDSSDFLPIDKPIHSRGRVDLAPVGGRSSDGYLPFFNLEYSGGGVVGAIGWTGQWALHFQRNDKQLQLQAGQETFRMKLHPGETIRSPRILLVFWKGKDSLHGNNLLRQLLLKHYVPRINGEIAIPPMALQTWFTYNQGNGVTEENQKAEIALAAKLGCEAFWIDAGWFEGGWPDGVGSWVPKPEAFPNGLKPVSDEAHRQGMKFVLWFEPERVASTSRIAKEHPEFVLENSDAVLSNPGASLLYNLGEPTARVWLTDFLSKCITDWGIDVFRTDFNMPLPRFWGAKDTADRQGITEIRYIEGFYQMWDELLARHPGLTIDNCAGGGRRLDLEMIKRSYPLWQSDTQCNSQPHPIEDQVQNAGLNLYIPLHSGGAWRFDPYNFRSMATTGLAICANLSRQTDNLPSFRKILEEAKSLRPLTLGDYYPLVDINTGEQCWSVSQFNRPDLGKGYVMAFRREKSPFSSAKIALCGLEAKADYTLTNVDTQEQKTVAGLELTREFSLEIPEKAKSVLLIYEKVKPTSK